MLWAAVMAWLVGVYLRETRRVNRDGTVVSYLQLAHKERHPRTGGPVAKVIHNFGRADKVDREALARLVASISRFLEPEQAASAGVTDGDRDFPGQVIGDRTITEHRPEALTETVEGFVEGVAHTVGADMFRQADRADTPREASGAESGCGRLGSSRIS